MYSRALVVAVVVLCVALAHAQQLYEGDACSLTEGGEGVCRSAANCPEVRELIRSGVSPKICSFINNQTIVCCHEVGGTTSGPQTPPTTPTPTMIQTPGTSVSRVDENTKAGRKCKEYARYVYVEIVVNPTLRIPERYNKSECVMPVEERVFGGADAVAKEFPHMASLGSGSKENIVWTCGGTLISERFVLTVAHCTNSGVHGDVRWVRLGEVNPYSDEDDARPIIVAVAERIRHEEYKRPAFYNDIALLRLESDVTFSPYIRPACLYTRPGNPPGNVNATATGWGLLKSHERVGSDTLKKLNLHFVENSICQKSFRRDMIRLELGVTTESMICAVDPVGEEDTCSGDSGGPLQIRLADPDPFCMYSVVGLTSFGANLCGVTGKPSVYTRVSYYIPWIERHVWP